MSDLERKVQCESRAMTAGGERNKNGVIRGRIG